MNNTVNEEAPIQNSEAPAVELPESATPKMLSIPRPLTLIRLLNQWQPMGIRVIINVPFQTDDFSYFFVLRNTPFIPKFNKGGTATSVYSFNNMRNVYSMPYPPFGSLSSTDTVYAYPKDYGISIVYHDYPPVISTIAESFRKWRGDMQYRFRMVAGFVTQAYFFAAPLKNCMMPIAKYNEYAESPVLSRQDLSYRESMTNSYVMSDSSMFRHLEITVPYEYPSPWFDQYQWMANRIFYTGTTDMIQETHGDNWVGLGCRGNVDSTEAKTITLELEYRCAEGFEFADPGLPPAFMNTPIRDVRAKNGSDSWMQSKTMPDTRYKSDGVNKISLVGNKMSTPIVELDTSDRLLRSSEKQQPSVEEMRQLYTTCTLSPSGDRTFCRTETQREWDAFPGDQRWRQGQPRSSEAVTHAGTTPAGSKVQKRETDFA